MDFSFKKNLRDELDYQDMTVKELSAKTGIPKPTLDSYLGIRETIPPADVAYKIASILNVSVEYLLTGKDNKLLPLEYEIFQPYRSILKDLSQLNDSTIHDLKIMIHALSCNTNNKNI